MPNIEFAPARTGRRVRLATLICFGLVGVGTVVAMVLMLRDPTVPRPMLAFAAIAPAANVLYWLAARVRRYRLVHGDLLVEFQFRTLSIPLAGMVGATADPEAMSRAWKVFGNEGLGAISGRFRSKRLGKFRAYLSDVEHAVVLRWPDRCVVVSPDKPSHFIEAVRERAAATH